MRSRRWLAGCIAALVVAGAATVAAVVVGDDDDIEAAPTFIPELDDPAAANCIRHYPDDLLDRPIAFDGTVEDIRRDAAGAPLVRENGQVDAEPWVVTLRVNDVYRGDVGDTVTMNTFNFDPTDGSRRTYRQAVGQRFLVATGETFAVDVCGFTRPWSEGEAAYWEQTFGDS